MVASPTTTASTPASSGVAHEIPTSLGIHSRWWAVPTGAVPGFGSHSTRIPKSSLSDGGVPEVTLEGNSAGYQKLREELERQALEKPISVILDSDPGVDDVVGLIYTLRSPRLKLLALTLTQGNTYLENCKRNVETTMTIVQRDCGNDITQIKGLPLDPKSGKPYLCVASGQGTPLVGDPHYAHYFHGADGLGGRRDELIRGDYDADASSSAEKTLADQNNWAKSLIRYSERLAEDEILEIVKREPPKSVIICAVGPQSNVARAIRKDPETMKRLRAVFIMGGAVHVPGNVTSLAEFNFYADPLAAQEVLRAAMGTKRFAQYLPETETKQAKDEEEARQSVGAAASPEQNATKDNGEGLFDVVLFSLDSTMSVGAIDSNILLDGMSLLGDSLKLEHKDGNLPTKTSHYAHFYNGDSAKMISMITSHSAAIYRGNIASENELRKKEEELIGKFVHQDVVPEKANLFMHDPLTLVAAALGPGCVRCDPEEIAVEPSGMIAKGSCIVDFRQPNRDRCLRRLRLDYVNYEKDLKEDPTNPYAGTSGIFICTNGDQSYFVNDFLRTAVGAKEGKKDIDTLTEKAQTKVAAK